MIRQILTTVLCCAAVVHARAQVRVPERAGGTSFAWLHFAERPLPQENPDDPGYVYYRDGYRLILSQDWAAAEKKFQELITRHPGSGYVDEAMYWSAYALKQTDFRKALHAYNAFTKAHAASRYFDDAVADIEELRQQIRLLSPPGAPLRVDEPDRHIRITLSPEVRRRMRRIQTEVEAEARIAGTPPTRESELLGQELKIKVETLHALARQRNDEQAFRTLREVARNQARPEPLRAVALRSLSEFNRFDVLPVATEIAKNDSSQELRSVAILVISEAGRHRDRAVDVLVELFRNLPADRAPDRNDLVYSIANIGNERAVDFLTDLAINEPDIDLRSTAIYCLGGIGGEKARTALTRILKAR